MNKIAKTFWTAWVVTLLLTVVQVQIEAASSLSVTKDEITKLSLAVSEAAGYKFKSTPSVELTNGSQIKKYYGEDEAFFTKAWKAKGVTSTGFQMRHRNLYGEYSWVKKKIYLASDMIQTGAKATYMDAKILKKMLLIHELVHALDDQYYGLQNSLTSAHTAESVLTFIATVEAHAYQVAQKVYIGLGYRQMDIDTVMKMEKSARLWPLYAKGMEFLKYVVDKNKHPLKEVFLHPPICAEELLSPDKYLLGGAIQYHRLRKNFSDLAGGLPWYFGQLTYTEMPQLEFFLASWGLGLPEEVVRGIKLKTTLIFDDRLDGEVGKRIQISTSTSPKREIDYEKGALVIDLYELTEQAKAAVLQDYCIALIETFKMANFTKRNIEFSYVLNRFPGVYVTYWEHREFGEVLDCLVALKGNYLVEICAMNLQISEEELAQTLDQIVERL